MGGGGLRRGRRGAVARRVRGGRRQQRREADLQPAGSAAEPRRRHHPHAPALAPAGRPARHAGLTPRTQANPLSMDDGAIAAVLDFLRTAERLKVTHRSAHTSAGEQESVAEHTWRLCLMALVLGPEFPEVDLARLLAMCVVHDLGEALGGDVPAPEQVRRAAAGETEGKAAQERLDLLELLRPLPAETRELITGLWDEYETAGTPEARLAKALDKLETILQHTQGRNPPGFDYRFNLEYGRQFTGDHPVIVAMREVLDQETERRARE